MAMTEAAIEHGPPADTHTNAPPKHSGSRLPWKKAPPPPPPKPPTAATFDSSEFFTAGGPRGGIERKRGGLRGRETNTERSTKVELSQPLKETYQEFLRSHSADLQRFKEFNRADYDAVMRNPNHRLEREIMAKIANQHGKIDNHKLDAFFQSPEGWILSKLLMDQQASLTMMALGVSASLNPGGNRLRMPETGDQGDVVLGVDQGTINRFLRERVGNWYDQRVFETAGRRNDAPAPGWMPQWMRNIGEGVLNQTTYGRLGLGTLLASWQLTSRAGSAIFGAAGLGVGVAMDLVNGTPGLFTAGVGTLGGALGTGLGALAPAATLGLMHSLRNGLTLEIRQCVGMYKTLTDPEKRYMREMSSVDPNDFQVNAAGTALEPRAGVTESSGITHAQERLLRFFYAGQMFNRELDPDPTNLNKTDAFPEQYLYRWNDRGPEQSGGLWWQKMINQEFQPNGGGVLDTAGLRPDQPGFDRNNIDYAGNLRRFTEARTRVGIRVLQNNVNRERRNRDESTKRKTQITAAIARYGGEGEKNQRAQEATDRKIVLDKQKKALEQKQNAYTERKRLQEEQRKAQAALQTEFGLTLPPNPTLANIEAAINTELTNIQDKLRTIPPNPPGVEQELNAQRLTYNNELAAEQNRLLAARNAVLKPGDSISPEEQRHIRERAIENIEETHGIRLRELQEQVNQLRTKRQNLENARNQYREQDTQRIDQERTIVNDAPKDLTEMTQAYETLINPAGGPPTINPNTLRTSTVDALIALATAPPYSIPNGTPEEQAALRQLITRAKTEERAREVEAFDPDPNPNNVTAFNDIIAAGAPITANDLLNRPEQQLANTLNADPFYAPLLAAIAAMPPPQPTPEEYINRARAATRRRLVVRYEISLEEQIRDIDSQAQQQQGRVDNADVETKRDLQQLQLAEILLNRQNTDILARIQEIGLTPDVFFSTTGILANAPGRLPSEVAIYTPPNPPGGGAYRLPQGYLELMNVFFDYREGTVPLGMTRDQYFQAVLRTLPPHLFAEILTTVPDFPSGPLSNNVYTALTRYRNQLTNHGYAGEDLIPAFGAVIDRYTSAVMPLT